MIFDTNFLKLWLYRNFVWVLVQGAIEYVLQTLRYMGRLNLLRKRWFFVVVIQKYRKTNYYGYSVILYLPTNPIANIVSVHLHCESTKVVKISCKYRNRLLDILDCRMLQSPFLKTALLRIFRMAFGLNDFLKRKSVDTRFSTLEFTSLQSESIGKALNFMKLSRYKKEIT